MSEPKTDPLVRSVRKIRREYAQTPSGELEALFKEESRWKRKLTIAQNKLAEVRSAINLSAELLAKEATGKDWHVGQ